MVQLRYSRQDGYKMAPSWYWLDSTGAWTRGIMVRRSETFTCSMVIHGGFGMVLHGLSHY